MGHPAVQRHGARGAHDLLQHGRDVFQARGAANQFGAALHGAVVAVAGGADLGQPLDEGGEQLLHLLLCFGAACACLGLLVDDVLETALYVVKAAQCQRRGGGCHQRFGLATQPVIVGAEGRDVLKHEAQQRQQAQAYGALLFGGERQAVGEVVQQQHQCGRGRCAFAQHVDELHRHVVHAGIVFTERVENVVHQTRELLGKVLGQHGERLCGGFLQRRACGVQSQVGVAHHDALQCLPVLAVDGCAQLL